MNTKNQTDAKELDEKFAAIPEGVKRQYDRHRFIRRAAMLFLAFLLIILTFSSLIPLISTQFEEYINANVSETVLSFVIIILSVGLTAFYLKLDSVKKYSIFFIKNQDASLAVFTFENIASLILILFPVLLFVSSATRGPQDELNGAGTLYGVFIAPICILVFLLCYARNKGEYTLKIKTDDSRTT
nr:hypothetical protein [uncultured Campylobacter sp.]